MDQIAIFAAVAVPAVLAWDGFRRWVGVRPDRDRLAHLETRVRNLEEQLRTLATPQPFRGAFG